MRTRPRISVVGAVLLVAASCSDGSGGGDTSTIVTATSTSSSSTSTSTTLPPAADTTLGTSAPLGTLADFSGQLFEDPFMDNGFLEMSWADERDVLVSRDSIMGSGAGEDLLGVGPILPAPATSGLSLDQLLVEAWVDNYTGDVVPTAIVLYSPDPSGWAATAVIDSEAVEEALLETTDYNAVAPGGPVAVEVAVSAFDWGAALFRAGVIVLEYLAGFQPVYQGEIECTIAEPLECTTLSDDGVLRPTDEGEQVEALQDDLATLGYLTGTVDGKYGPQTAAAVSALQTDYLLTVDGKAGPNTLGLIGDLVAGTSELILASADGIATVDFGVAADAANGDLIAIFGPPDNSTGWYVDACDGNDWLQTTWEGFTAIFTDREGSRQFDGWKVDDLSNLPSGLVIAGGLNLGWTWSDFAAAGASFNAGFGGFFTMLDLGYNNGRFVDPPSNPPAGGALIRGFGTGTGAFVSC